MNPPGGARRALAAVAAGCALVAAPAPAQLPPPDPQPQPETRPALARIAFTADGAIHTIAADGSDRRRLTAPGKDDLDEDPAWSPDGSAIAFTRLDLEDESLEIWLVNRDGSGVRRLSADEGLRGGLAGPAWSPDGERVAFTTFDNDERRDRTRSSLVTVRLDGTDRRVIHSESTRKILLFSSPAWSPSGDRILFTRSVLFDDEGPPALHLASVAGAGARRIVGNGDYGSWAPSGDRIAYSALHQRGSGRACAEFCPGAGEIHVANADGSGRVRLTASPANDRRPAWSGDGLRVVFESDRNSIQAEDEESPPELYSMRADGSCVTWLTNGTAYSESPDFERGAGLSSDPGGCGAVSREPLVETGMPKEFRRPFASWWLGRVAPNGLLLTHVSGDPHTQLFGYHDCGRFDPKDCGEFVNVENRDLCATGGLRQAGRSGTRLSIARGALYQETRNELDNIGFSVLFTHRTRVLLDTASGHPFPRGLIAGLRRFPAEEAGGEKLPSTRLPTSLWRQLRTTKGVSRREAARRRAVARRLAQLGVKRRLGC